jgi:hypothetical protein
MDYSSNVCVLVGVDARSLDVFAARDDSRRKIDIVGAEGA